MLEWRQQPGAQALTGGAQAHPQAGHLQFQVPGSANRRRGLLEAIKQPREVLAGEVSLGHPQTWARAHASGRRPRPASRVDLVDRVEQEVVLHVVVALQAWWLERGFLARAGCRGRFHRGPFLADDQAVLPQLRQQRRDGRADLGLLGLEPADKSGADLGLADPLAEQLPDRRPAAGKAVVTAVGEIDRDHLSVDRLVNDLGTDAETWLAQHQAS